MKMRVAVMAAVVEVGVLVSSGVGGPADASLPRANAATSLVAERDPGDPNWPGQLNEFQKDQLRAARDRYEQLKHLLIPEEHFSPIARRRLIRPGPLGRLFRPGVYDPYWPGWNRAVEIYPKTRGFSPLEMVQALERAKRYGTLEVARQEFGRRNNVAEIDAISRRGPRDRGSGLELKQLGAGRTAPTKPMKSLTNNIGKGNSTFTRNPRIPLRFRRYSIVAVDAEHVPFKRPVSVRDALQALRNKLASLPKTDARHRWTRRFEISVGERTPDGRPQLVVYEKRRGFYVVQGTVETGLQETECPREPDPTPDKDATPKPAATRLATPDAAEFLTVSFEAAPATPRYAGLPPCGEQQKQQPDTKPDTAPDQSHVPAIAPSGLRDSLLDAKKLGGIDFTAMELRYLSVDETDEGMRLSTAYRIPDIKGGIRGSVADGVRSAMQASDAFFVWLSLPPSTFWVNLNPDEPNRVIDKALGRTEVGRILLEADRRLKQTDSRLVNPHTRLGARFWNHQRPAPDGSYCFTYRLWIVPGPAKVRETEDAIYIVDAPLKVNMQPIDIVSGGCGKQPAAVKRHNAALYRRLILPHVVRAVNEAPEYRALRRVYLSRIAAEWYRERSETEPLAYSDLIDSGDIRRWQLKGSWTPRQTYRGFLRDWNSGKFDYRVRERHGNVVTVRTYRTGGVDFSRLFEQSLSADAFEELAPGLESTVEKGLRQATVDPHTRDRWLGGTSEPAVAAETEGEQQATSVIPAPDDPWSREYAPYVVPLMIVAGVGLIAYAIVRERRRQHLWSPR